MFFPLATLSSCPHTWQYHSASDKCYGATAIAVDWATAVNTCLSVTNNAGKLTEPRDNASGQFVRDTFGTSNLAFFAHFS